MVIYNKTNLFWEDYLLIKQNQIKLRKMGEKKNNSLFLIRLKLQHLNKLANLRMFNIFIKLFAQISQLWRMNI